MEVENQDTVENLETLPAEGAVTPEQGGEVTPPLEGEATPQLAAQQAPQYTPNYTYDYRTLEGTKEKKEFDERLRSIIKSKEDEEFVRQLVTKAEGLEVNKRNLSQYQEQFTTLQQEHQTLRQDVDFVLAARDRGDVLTALQAIGFNKKQIREAVYHDLQAEDLPQHQKEAYDKRRELEAASFLERRKIQELESKVQSFEVQSRKAELEKIISEPDTNPIAQDFDRRNGQNAFWNTVVQHGLMYKTQFGIDKSPKEVIQEVITRYNLRAPEAPTKTVSAPKTLPVLPNTGASSSQVPLKQKPKTRKELVEYAKTLED